MMRFGFTLVMTKNKLLIDFRFIHFIVIFSKRKFPFQLCISYRYKRKTNNKFPMNFIEQEQRKTFWTPALHPAHTSPLFHVLLVHPKHHLVGHVRQQLPLLNNLRCLKIFINLSNPKNLSHHSNPKLTELPSLDLHSHGF